MIFANYSKGIKPPISAAVHGAGMCDEPRRMSAWEAKEHTVKIKLLGNREKKRNTIVHFELTYFGNIT